MRTHAPSHGDRDVSPDLMGSVARPPPRTTICGMHKRHIFNVIPRALRVARIVERWNATAAFSLLKTSKSGRRPLQKPAALRNFPCYKQTYLLRQCVKREL